MKKYFSVILLAILASCNGTKEETKTSSQETYKAPSHHTASITKVFDAHGGYDTWSGLKTISYEFNGSKTLVDLQNRYTRIDSDNQQVGFDGKNVWVNPPSENADRQRMRYNLMFYFYAFPFVIGDPGVNYEDMEPITLDGVAYNAVKISYNDGVGDSPKDNYIILSDQESNQMKWLMYTATFGGGESSDRFSLIKYDGWQDRGGVILPTSLQWYQYSDGVVGEPRGGARTFENVQMAKDFPAMSNFTAPEGAHIIQN